MKYRYRKSDFGFQPRLIVIQILTIIGIHYSGLLFLMNFLDFTFGLQVLSRK